MSEGPRRKNLRQYVVYLNKNIDKDIIDHLEPLLGEKRANEEVRRMLHAALKPSQYFTARTDYPIATYEDDVTRSIQPIADAKQKARQTFGGFEE